MQAKHPIHIKHNENKEFKKSLGYIARACLKTNKAMKSQAVSLFTWQYTRELRKQEYLYCCAFNAPCDFWHLCGVTSLVLRYSVTL